MSNLLPIKKIYCDTKFKRKDSKSNSNFKIDLPQTLKLPDNCIFYIDDVSIPYAWHTVETGVNDKMYFRLKTSTYVWSDYIIVLDSKTYNGTQFAAEVQSKITSITSGASTSCVHDSQTQLMSVSVANLDINIFTDSELKGNIGWTGSSYNVKNLASANELLSNEQLPSPVGNTANPAEYYLMLTPIRNIYI